MSFDWADIADLLAQLEAEARGDSVDVERIRREAERLMAQYPGMAGLLAPIAERHAREAA